MYLCIQIFASLFSTSRCVVSYIFIFHSNRNANGVLDDISVCLLCSLFHALDLGVDTTKYQVGGWKRIATMTAVYHKSLSLILRILFKFVFIS